MITISGDSIDVETEGMIAETETGIEGTEEEEDQDLEMTDGMIVKKTGEKGLNRETHLWKGSL